MKRVWIWTIGFSLVSASAVAAAGDWKAVGNDRFNAAAIAAIDAHAATTKALPANGDKPYTISHKLDAEGLKRGLSGWIQAFVPGSNESLGAVWINPVAVAWMSVVNCHTGPCANLYGVSGQPLGQVPWNNENMSVLAVKPQQ